MRFLSLLLTFIQTLPAVTVSTAQYNNSRTGANTSETVLTQAKVTAGNFGKLGRFAVDGAILAQPLIIDSGCGVTHALVISTMHNSIYCFNADKPGSSELWKVNVGAAYTGYPPGETNFYGGEVGCAATPVVDTGAAVVYAVCVASNGDHKLYALNLADGTTFHAAVTISGTSNGLTFSATTGFSRTGLLLSGGKIYFGFGSYADEGSWQGWVFAYNSTTLAQTAALALVNTTGGEAGVWMGGGGLSADGSGNVYLVSGNGDWDGTVNFGESFIKLDSSLAVLSYGTPANWATINGTDFDLGSGRAMLVSTFVMGGGKDGRWWLFNQSDLGSLQGTGTGPVQVWQALSNATYRTFNGYVFANSTLFLGGRQDKIYSFAFGGSTFTTTAAASTSATFEAMDALAYSSNGSTAGTPIIWATTADLSPAVTARQGTLRAFNATTMAELWHSSGTDSLGQLAKFAQPTVANGRVYVSTTDSGVVVFGELSGMRGLSTLRGRATKR